MLRALRRAIAESGLYRADRWALHLGVPSLRNIASSLLIPTLAATIFWCFLLADFWLSLLDEIEDYVDPYPWFFVSLLVVVVFLATIAVPRQIHIQRPKYAAVVDLFVCALIVTAAGSAVFAVLKTINWTGFRFTQEARPFGLVEWDALFRGLAVLFCLSWFGALHNLATVTGKSNVLWNVFIRSVALCGVAMAAIGLALFAVKRLL
jgi:hypothetical protein